MTDTEVEVNQHLDEVMDELAKEYEGGEFAAAEHGAKLMHKRCLTVVGGDS